MATKTVTTPAQERFIALMDAMTRVQNALDDCDRLITRMRPVRANWRTTSREEMQNLRRSAQRELDDMRDTAKRFEAELISREWRP
ncbi:hypothetical protein ACFQ1S_04310 [Kibdelosporangium lantanae]|uniref:WXG100 family type VII secretion target n=1 Tax=Kibdelosporangium lantanae TaxID=1497396 RepID=A0ABW3M4M9_9PSEU